MRGCGIALALGAALLILVNAILTPMQPLGQGEAVLRTSGVYAIRLAFAMVICLLLLFGSLGLHLAQRHRGGAFGFAAFLIAFLGTALLLCVEWANLFILRPLAQTTPRALGPLDKSTMVNVGFAATAALFALGWLLLSGSLWRAGIMPRWASITTAAGLLSIAVLGASPLRMTGAIAGNVVFGLGLIGLGLALTKGMPGPTPDPGSI